MALDMMRSFDAPVPGQSLTAELGARPWQSPPQYPTVDEAIQYYMRSMTTEEFMDQIIDVLEMGVSVADVANVMQVKSVMDGIHSVDVGVMVTPVIMEMIMFLADSAGIEYEKGTENPDKKKLSGAKKARVLQQLKEETEDMDMAEEAEETVEEIEVSKEEPKGLMARRS